MVVQETHHRNRQSALPRSPGQRNYDLADWFQAEIEIKEWYRQQI
ncbi:MAG: hypothetical protein WBX14_06705 [Candidatus Udaeobacter sp.]